MENLCWGGRVSVSFSDLFLLAAGVAGWAEFPPLPFLYLEEGSVTGLLAASAYEDLFAGGLFPGGLLGWVGHWVTNVGILEDSFEGIPCSWGGC